MKVSTGDLEEETWVVASAKKMLQAAGGIKHLSSRFFFTPLTEKQPSILSAAVEQIKVLCYITTWLDIDTDIYSFVSVWRDISLSMSQIISE